jgi:hypothetical protein
MSDYAQLVAESLRAHITERQPSRSLTPLGAVLGCRVLGAGGKLLPASTVDPAYEDLISQTLVTAFLALKEPASWTNYDRFAILDGLTKNQRWRQCIDTKNRIDLLVSLLLRFSYGSGHMYRDMQEGVTDLLNDWLVPAVKIAGRPTLEQVVSLLYGPAWWSVCVEPNSEPSASRIMDMLALMNAPYCEAISGERQTMQVLPDLGGA